MRMDFVIAEKRGEIMKCNNCLEPLTVNDETTTCARCKALMHIDCANGCVECHSAMCDDCVIAYRKCDECGDADVVHMEFISSTMFEGYIKCPWLFYNEQILQKISEAERGNKYSALGSLIHDLCHIYSVQNREASLEIILTAYQMAFNDIDNKYFEDEDDAEKFYCLGVVCLTNFYTQEQHMTPPTHAEEQWFLKLDPELPLIRVTMDRLQQYDDDYELHDYKTGKVYSSDMLRNNMQLPIYAMAIKHKFGVYPTKLVLRFIQHNKERVFVHEGEGNYVCVVKGGGTYRFSVDKKKVEMKKIWNDIRRGHFPRNTSKEYFCRDFCPLGKADQCDGLNTRWSGVKYNKPR